MLKIFDPFKLLFTDSTLSSDVIFFSLILILLPIALITGPAIPDIFLSIIALYFLAKSIINKNWVYYKNYIVIGFLLFSFYGVIRSLFSEMPIQSLTNEGSLFYFRYIFFSLGVWYLLDNNPYLSKCFIIISFICIVIVCVDGIYQYFNEFNFFGNRKHNATRLTGFFGKEPIIGRYVAYLSMFTFALIYQNYPKTKKMITISIVFLVICEVTVFLSGERAPLFYLGLFSVLVIMFVPYYRFFRIIGIVISALIIWGILEINPTVKTRVVDHTFEQVKDNHLPYLPYSSDHEKIYISAFKMFSDNPIFGVGTNTFRYNCNLSQYKYKDGCRSHPHNIYIQLLAEKGLFGFSFLFYFFLYLFFIGLKQLYFLFTSNKKNLVSFEILLYPIIIFTYLWPFIPTMSFYNNWLNVFIMLSLGYFMKYFFR